MSGIVYTNPVHTHAYCCCFTQRNDSLHSDKGERRDKLMLPFDVASFISKLSNMFT